MLFLHCTAHRAHSYARTELLTSSGHWILSPCHSLRYSTLFWVTKLHSRCYDPRYFYELFNMLSSFCAVDCMSAIIALVPFQPFHRWILFRPHQVAGPTSRTSFHWVQALFPLIVGWSRLTATCDVYFMTLEVAFALASIQLGIAAEREFWLGMRRPALSSYFVASPIPIFLDEALLRWQPASMRLRTWCWPQSYPLFGSSLIDTCLALGLRSSGMDTLVVFNTFGQYAIRIFIDTPLFPVRHCHHSSYSITIVFALLWAYRSPIHCYPKHSYWWFDIVDIILLVYCSVFAHSFKRIAILRVSFGLRSSMPLNIGAPPQHYLWASVFPTLPRLYSVVCPLIGVVHFSDILLLVPSWMSIIMTSICRYISRYFAFQALCLFPTSQILLLCDVASSSDIITRRLLKYYSYPWVIVIWCTMYLLSAGICHSSYCPRWMLDIIALWHRHHSDLLCHIPRHHELS